MVLQRIRRAAAVLSLAATLALAAPAHAAGWEDLAAPAWLERAMEWVSRLWVGNGDVTTPTPAIEKCGTGIDPSGLCSGAAPSTMRKYGGGLDPNGSQPPPPSSLVSGSGSGG